MSTIPGNGAVGSDNSLQVKLYSIATKEIYDAMLFSSELLPRTTRNGSGLILLNDTK